MKASELRVGDEVDWTRCGIRSLHAAFFQKPGHGTFRWRRDGVHETSDGTICDACTIHRVIRDGVRIFDDSGTTRTYGDGECIATDVTIDPADNETLRVALADMAKAMVRMATERDELRAELDTERKRHAATVQCFNDFKREIRERCK